MAIPRICPLTTSADTGTAFTGTSGNDTYVGTLTFASDAIASTATLTAGDALTGGSGTDTLNITVTGAAVDNAGYTATPTLTGIEKVLVANFETDANADDNVTIDLALADTALTTIGTSSSTAVGSDTNFSNVGQLVAVEMAGKGGLSVAFTSGAVTGTADSLTVTANGVGTSATTLSTVTFNGIETANITSSTASNYLSVDGDASLTTVNISGAKNMTVDVETTVTTVSASAATGNVKVFAEGLTLANVTLTGGTGTDTLSFDDDITVTSSADGLETVTGFEKIALTAVKTIALSADVTGLTTIITGDADDQTVTLGTGLTQAITVDMTGDTANNDTVTNTANVALTVVADSTDVTNTVNLTGGTGVDTLQITAAGGTVELDGVTDFDTITILAGTLGTEDVTMDVGGLDTAIDADATLVIDASALTNSGARLDFTGTGELDGFFSVTGGAGNDSIIGGSVADTIDGGANNDTIDGAAGNDVITGGAGNDSITAGTGNDSINAGDGNDSIVFAGATDLTANDTVDGGAGTDTLKVSSVSSTALTNVTNVENLAVTGASTISLTSNLAFTTIDISADANDQILTFGTGYTAATGVTIGGQATNADKVVNTANIALTITADVADIDSVTTITGGTGTDTLVLTADNGTADFTSVTAVDAVTVAKSATAGEDATFTLGAYATAMSIDASALTAATEVLTVSGSSATKNLSITGGAGNDSIVGGAGNDSILGGDNKDTITSGAGNDSISGGAGNDTVIMAASLTYQDTVAGGTGTNTITADSSGLSDVSFQNVTGFTTLTLTSNGGTTTLATFAQTAGITTVNTATTASVIDAAGTTTGMTFVSKASGNETITGGSGNDTFKFDDTNTLAATDDIVGGNGTDTIVLNNSAASLTATVDFNTGNVTGVEQMTLGTASGLASNSAETIGLTIADITLTTVQTITIDGSVITDSNDTISITNNVATTTGGTKFSIVGGAGADTLAGGVNADTISGGDGADSITGSLGADSLTGGAGADTFNYNLGNSVNAAAAQMSTNSGADTISDFTSGTDHLQITMATATAGMTFDATDKGNVTSNADVLSLLSGSGAAPDVANRLGQYAFNTTTSTMVMDSDGNGLIQASDFAVILTGATALADTDIDFKITTANGANSVTIGNGNNTVVGGTGADTITTGSGADDITTGDTGAADVIVSGGGNDIIRTATVATASYNMGAGSADTLVLTANGLNLATGLVVAGTDDFVSEGGIEQLITTHGGTTTLNGTLLTGDTLAINSIAAGNVTIALGTLAVGTNTFAGLTFAAVTYGSATGIALGNDDNDIITVTLGNGANTFTGTSIVDQITGGTGADNITAGGGNDTIIMGANLTVADVITGGLGTDTMTITDDTAATDLDGVSGVEVISATGTGASVYTLSGNTLIAAGANLTFNNAAAQDMTLNIAANTTTGTLTYVGNTGVDTVTTGSGAATVTGGAGADVITLTSTSADTVVLAAGSSATMDAVTGFTAVSDILVVSITAQAGSLLSTGANVAITAATTAVVKHISTATASGAGTTLGATDNIVILDGTLANTAAVKAHIGTSNALITNVSFTANSDLIVVWSDNTDSYVSLVNDSNAGSTATLVAAELTLVEVVKLVGIDATELATLTAADFAFMA